MADPIKPTVPAAPAAPAAPPTATPAPAPTPVSTIATPSRPTVPAKALGLDDPTATLDHARTKLNAGLPKDTTPKPPAPAPEPAKPDPTPAPAPEPAKPDPTPAPAPEPAKTIKIGGREYTPEQLEKILAGQTPPQAPEPAPAPTPAAPAPTKEEIAKRESEWIANRANGFDYTIPAESLDAILVGGEDGVKAFVSETKRAVATAVLQARKNVFDEINAKLMPTINSIEQVVAPLFNQHVEVQKHMVEQQFLTKHKEFLPHRERAKSVAEALMATYPEQVSKMSSDQFIDEVARQTNIQLLDEYKRWHPDATDWRQHHAAPAAPAPAAPTPAPVLPPAANVPTAVAPTGKMDWHKSVAASLRE